MPASTLPITEWNTLEMAQGTGAVGSAGKDGWRPARGALELGAERATTVDQPGVNALRGGA